MTTDGKMGSIFNWAAATMVRAKFLKDWNGILQTDGYQVYDQVGGPGLIHVGCWAHARRKFVDAVKVNPKDGAAVAMVTRMDALFLVDRHARQQELGAAERAALRLEHAQPWVDEIHSECVKLRSQLLPKSALGEAVNYTLNMWAKLRRCFDHAEVELSNNVAENSMRPVAIGRKNWLHVGSAKSGPEGRGDSVGGGILPAAERAGQRISAGRPARNESTESIGSRCTHPSPLESRSHLTWFSRTHTNNGKTASQTDNVSGEQVTYTYDALNRLATAQATSAAWGQSYTYDGFGNLTDQNVIAGSAPMFHAVYNPLTNNDSCADANGNETCFGGLSGYGYDVENRLRNDNNGFFKFSYAPGNKRIWRGDGTGGNGGMVLTSDEVAFWGVGDRSWQPTSSS